MADTLVVARPSPPKLPDVVLTRPARSLWGDAWRRLARNRAALAGLAIILALLFVALFADRLAPYPYEKQDLTQIRKAPSPAHWFGTDELGRDVLSRMMFGARISMVVGLVTQLIIVSIGVPIGALAGYFGGKLDTLLMRFVDVMYSFPDLLLIIIVSTTLRASFRAGGGGPIGALANADEVIFGGLLGVFIALGITSWLTVARLVRAQVLSLKERGYVEAARALGAGPGRLIFSHLLPNSLAPVIVATTFGIPSAILTEASLSFIGLGVQPPMASWGSMILEGYKAIRATPHLIIFPAAGLSLTVLAYNFFGDGLRDALDPWMSR